MAIAIEDWRNVLVRKSAWHVFAVLQAKAVAEKSPHLMIYRTSA